MKKCNYCDKDKKYSSFNKRKASKDGLQHTCKTCQSIQKKEYRKNNFKKLKIQNRKSDLKRKYNISLGEYDELLNKQKKVCAICNKNPSNINLSVDHCHDSNNIRGLLCSECNFGLGNFKDSIKLLKKAIKYLGG